MIGNDFIYTGRKNLLSHIAQKGLALKLNDSTPGICFKPWINCMELDTRWSSWDRISLRINDQNLQNHSVKIILLCKQV